MQAFYSNEAATRLAWLSNIEAAVSNGDDSIASALLLSAPSLGTTTGAYNVKIRDLAAANSIIANYTDYYQFYLRWHDSTFSCGDLANLTTFANKCPLTDGAVIYQARALLRRLTQQIIVYSDNCLETDGETGGGARIIYTTKLQTYSLMPNPNDGNMQLWQSIADNESVNIKVYNSIGAVVYSGNHNFQGNASNLQLDRIIPGIYHIKLHDSKGNEFTLQFVKK